MLENAGFAAYAVGGCVRDFLLGLIPHDYDLCTAATPDEIQHVFSDYRLVLAGKKHGTVSVLMDDNLVEITTFRTEGGYTDNRIVLERCVEVKKILIASINTAKNNK